MSGVNHHGQNQPKERGLVGGRMGGRDVQRAQGLPWQGVAGALSTVEKGPFPPVRTEDRGPLGVRNLTATRTGSHRTRYQQRH